jgi:hypothetical protein
MSPKAARCVSHANKRGGKFINNSLFFRNSINNDYSPQLLLITGKPRVHFTSKDRRPKLLFSPDDDRRPVSVLLLPE